MDILNGLTIFVKIWNPQIETPIEGPDFSTKIGTQLFQNYIWLTIYDIESDGEQKMA